MKAIMAGLIGAALLLPALSQPSFAQGREGDRDRERHEYDRREQERREHERFERERHHEWHGDIRGFHEHDLGIWRGGAWYHGVHEGRNGWWWRVGPSWYFYTAPVYPYPDPYVPPVIAAPTPSPQQFWYYCRNPQGYYPYVPQCFGNWEAVPAG